MLSKLKVKAVLAVSNRVSYKCAVIDNINKTPIVLALVAVSYMNTAQAQEHPSSSQDFQFHGFISQGIIDVNGSDFVNDSGDISTELTEIGVNASYQLSSDFRLAGQVVYLNGGNRYSKGARVDYALVDWSAFTNEDWQANIYLGRFKNNHWLYSSSRDIPFARPSIILPQSAYFDGFRDIAVGSDGLAVKLSHNNDEYGDFDFQASYGTSHISKEQQVTILSGHAMGRVKQDHDAQASLYWQPAFSALRLGVSILDAKFTYDSLGQGTGDVFADGKFSFRFYTLNALYEGENWEFSGELYQQLFTTDGFYTPDYYAKNVGRGYYLQTRYKLTQKITLLARYEDFYLNKDDKDGRKLEENSGGLIPYYFGFHKDTTVGLNYDITSNFSARVEYHWVKGAAKLTPVVLPNPAINDSENWDMWAIQLMYWF